MLFKDDDGREFEEVDVKELSDVQPQDLVIRPVKQEPKYRVELIQDAWDIGDMTIEIRLGVLPKDQAQLIKDWISEGMKYITGETDRHNGYIEAMDKARAALEDK